VRKVALLIETDRAYGRGILRGISRYSHLHGPWSCYLEPGSIPRRLPELKGWGCQGIIARVERPAFGAAIKRLGLPAVVLGYEAAAGQVRVGTHSENEGRMAAAHLLERGFRQFAYCGVPKQYSGERQRGFAERIEARGCRVSVYQRRWTTRERWWNGEQEHLAAWIAGLTKPAGLFACNADQGRRVLEACLAAGVAVPEEVAVLAVDDDEILCSLAHPRLSTIVLNTEKAGFEAAAALDRLMAGRKPDRWEIVVEPGRVVTRQSTDVLAIEDRDVALAVQFIRERATSGITVRDVLDAVPVSRRTLECRFQQFLGRSPHAEILRTRLERVKTLLVSTDLPMPKVAEAAGFATPEYMACAFRRETGIKPGEYRRQHRGS